MRNLFLSIFFFAYLASIQAQNFPVVKAKEDLQFLVENIKTYNPALEIYNPKFDEETKAIFQQVDDDIDILDFFSMLSRIAALSNEGHFGIHDWSDTVHNGFFDDRYKYMPLSVYIRGGKVFVKFDFSHEDLMEVGDEILSINGEPVNEIMQKLCLHIPADGNIKTYQGIKAEEGFSWLYYFYIDRPDSFEIVFRRDEIIDTMKMEAITRTERFKAFEERRQKAKDEEKESIDDFYELSFKDETAFLKLKSFDYKLVEKYNLKAKKLYKEIFKEIEENKAKFLVVDLRYNTGGRNEFADDMVPFILQNKEDDFLKRTISWEGKEKEYKFPRKHKNAFQGKVFVLVNGKTYSAGASLARYLNEYAGAIVIGEETGTRYEGFAAGSSQRIYLPNSGLRIDIPRYHILYPVSEIQKTSNRGLLPDHEIKYRIEDILGEQDLEMQLVEELIREY